MQSPVISGVPIFRNNLAARTRRTPDTLIEAARRQDNELTEANWRRWMGIEPTWDFVEPHAGFEDQERHQAALHLHLPEPEKPIARAGNIHTIRCLSLPPIAC